MTLLIIHSRYGGAHIEGLTKQKGPSLLYTLGLLPAKHLPPAIRQRFEWGKDLLTGEVVLIHMKQEAYYDQG